MDRTAYDAAKAQANFYGPRAAKPVTEALAPLAAPVLRQTNFNGHSETEGLRPPDTHATIPPSFGWGPMRHRHFDAYRAGFQQGNVVGEQYASRGQAEPTGEDLDDLARDEAERLHVTRDRNQWTKGFRDGFARGFERFRKQAFFDVTSLHLVSLIAECKFSA